MDVNKHSDSAIVGIIEQIQQNNMAKSFEISTEEKSNINASEPTITYFPKQQTATTVIVGPAAEKPSVSNLINDYIERLTHFDKDKGCWPRDALKTISIYTDFNDIAYKIRSIYR